MQHHKDLTTKKVKNCNLRLNRLKSAIQALLQRFRNDLDSKQNMNVLCGIPKITPKSLINGYLLIFIPHIISHFLRRKAAIVVPTVLLQHKVVLRKRYEKD
jgi:hypothetical protein